MTTPCFCRVAIVVDDMPGFVADAGRLLGIDFVVPVLDVPFDGFSVRFGEHGLEPISLEVEMPFARDGRLIEVAIDVASADATKAALAAGGFEPVVTNFLPAPAANEYLFGRDFHGLPVMVCTAGDNETQMRRQMPFRALADAPLPRIGCVTLLVDDLAATAADFKRFFGMEFVPTDPAGLGDAALVGAHRIKLVGGGGSGLAAGLQAPLAAIEFMYDDVEPVRQRFVDAGYPVLHERALKSGGKAYYFGATVQHMPIAIYPANADAEILGSAG